MDPSLIVMIVLLVQRLARPLLYVVSDQLALNFLFGGTVRPTHTTKFALDKFVGRYGESIDNLNRAIVLSVAFVPIALLSTSGDMKIPLIDLQVTRHDWLRVCPAISYGLQVFTLVGLCWFLLLRRGLALLKKPAGNADYFGDISNIMLTGVVGSLWMFFAIPRHIPTRLHFFWLAPVGLIFLVVMFSPSVLCGYFVYELFAVKDFVPALVYSVLLLPSAALAVVLLGLSIVTSVGEAIYRVNDTASPSFELPLIEPSIDGDH